MRVFNDLGELPDFRNAVVTIGSFDGVHSGHQQILRQVNRIAEEIEGESIVITFHPHPRLIIQPQDTDLQLLTTVEEKIQLLGRYGIDNVVVVPFTIEFSQQTADEYIEHFLIEKFNPACIVIGYDHRFGRDRSGDINYLKAFAEKAGFRIKEIPPQEVEDITVSSTKIRKALETGEVRRAGRLLGHSFMLTGKVIRGERIGTELGFPTANLDLANQHKLVPPDGVYAVRAHHKGQSYGGMLYIGNRPTLPDLPHRNIEVNLFGFDLDIYGDKLRLDLIERLRGDMAFDGLQALRTQLAQDRRQAMEVLQVEAQTQKIETSDWPRVAAVLLNFNTRQLLEEMLPRLQETRYPALQIVVIDNGSDDGSAGFLRARHPEVRVITLEENLGFAGGYNRGLREVEADYYALLNTDVLVEPDWLNPLVEALEQEAAVGAVMPKVLDYHQRDQFEYAGASGGWIDFLGYPFCRGRIFNTLEKDRGQYDETQDIFWASGAALVIRPALFRKLGGFEEAYFAHQEEIDLCWRMKRAGFRILAVPAGKVYHMGGGTLNYQSARKTYLNFRNNLYTILKNERKRTLAWLLPLRLVLDGLAGLQFLLSGKTAHTRAIVRAHWTFFITWRRYWKRRQLESERIAQVSIRPEMDRAGIYSRSIVWQYFLRGRKTFKDLP